MNKWYRWLVSLGLALGIAFLGSLAVVCSSSKVTHEVGNKFQYGSPQP